MELHSNIIYVYRFDILLIYPRLLVCSFFFFFFSSRRRHTRLQGDWSSDVCSSDLLLFIPMDFYWGNGHGMLALALLLAGSAASQTFEYARYAGLLRRPRLADA